MKDENSQQAIYPLLVNVLVVLMALGCVIGFYITFPYDSDVERIQAARYPGSEIINIALANLARLAMFFVAYFVFTNNKNARSAALAMLILLVAHSITYSYPNLAEIYYSFNHLNLRLYLFLLSSIVLVFLLYKKASP